VRLAAALRALSAAGLAAAVVLAVWVLMAALSGPAITDPRAAGVQRLQVAERVDGPAREPVALPYHWDREHPGEAGRAQFILRFSTSAPPAEPWGLYLPRVGNAYAVWLNGVLVQAQGDVHRPNGSNHGQVPRLLSLPPGLLLADNTLRIDLRADLGRRGGLSAAWVGPMPLVEPLYERGHRWRVTGSQAVVGFSLLVAATALALWLTQVGAPAGGGAPRREPLYALAALAELCWALRVGDALIEDPPLPWPWWGVVPVVAMAVWAWAMGTFCLHLAGWPAHPAARVFRRALLALLPLSLLAAWAALAWGVPAALTAWYGALAVLFLGFGAVLFAVAWRPGGRAGWQLRLVSLAVLVNVAVGLRDLYWLRLDPVLGEGSLMRYSSVLFGVVLALIVIARFRAVAAQARDLMAHLTQRVRDREEELARSYAAMANLAQEQARAAERTRILRDMHDGVGAHLASAIRQLRADGAGAPSHLLQTLRDSLDQLKLSVDALQLPAGDVQGLLAGLRHRLEPRLVDGGLTYRHDAVGLPPWPALDATALHELQYLLFEALSNVLQHAAARSVTLHARASATGLVIAVIDDGVGFDATRPPGKGLRALQTRARAIGARLVVRSHPGHTAVEVWLPPAAG